MHHRFSLILPLLAALAVPGLAAASGSGDHTHMEQGTPVAGKGNGHAAALGKPASTKAATKTLNIEMGDSMRFSPEQIEIKQGESVRFVVHNAGRIKHEMVLDTFEALKNHAALMAKNPGMEHDDPNAVSVAPGKTGEFAWTFTKAGNFDFACLLPGHFEAGMKGRILVKK